MKREELNAGWINTIHESVDKAIVQATLNGTEVVFDFNGINVIVDSTSNRATILRDYNNAHLMNWAEIGPHPVVEYDAKTKAEISLAKYEQEEKEKERRRAYEEEAAKKSEAFNKEVEGIKLEFSDKEGFDSWKAKNTDDYGNACFVFAENWGRLMQKHIAEGKTIAECASADSHAADTEGITGFMYGMAVGVLSKCWKHGEELRKWHNKDYGQEGAEGVVNPALVTISSKDEE